MTVRHVIIALNLVAVVAIVGLPDLGRAVAEARVRRDRAREPHAVPPRRRPRKPASRTRAGLGAAVRRGRRGRAAALLAARAEPSEGSRPATSPTTRPSAGEILFSNATMPKYDPAQSLQCANCHGSKGQGGRSRTSSSTVTPWRGRCRRSTPCCCGSRKTRAAPSPSTAADAVCNVTQIITYGRPGTPMQAVGCRGWRTEERPVDPGPRRVPAHDPAEARRRRRRRRPEPRAGAVDESEDSCPQYMSCPQLAGRGRASDAEDRHRDARTSPHGAAEGARPARRDRHRADRGLRRRSAPR